MTEKPIDKLLATMAALRDKDTGCPWDVEQTFQSLAKYTIEEAYEVADAAQRNHRDDLVEELGDLLLQVVFYAQIAQEDRLFSFDEIAERLVQKLVSRHPHVFGDKEAQTAGDVVHIWEAQKDKEKAAKESVLDDIPSTLPPLQRAEKLIKRAGKTGFKFDTTEQARAKFYEELKEFEATPNKDEYGDVLFSFIGWARMALAADEIRSDEALDHANRKFETRFRATEKLAKTDKPQTLDDWTALWEKGKSAVN